MSFFSNYFSTKIAFQRSRLGLALLLTAAVVPTAHAGTPFYVLDAQGKEAEATIQWPVVGNVSTKVDRGGPPANLRNGPVPSPATYAEWSQNPSNFAFSRGDARRFSVGLGRVGDTTGGVNGGSFVSVIRYQPTDAFRVSLKVDPLQMFFAYTGDLEGATPSIESLTLGFNSRFHVSWFDPTTSGFKSFGRSYVSTGLITASASESLSATESSRVQDANGITVDSFSDANVFADQGIGAASIIAPAVERTLGFSGLPTLPSGSFAELYLVYEMSVFNELELVPGFTGTRKPFMFAVAGDPIALDDGDFRPTIEISPVPEPSTVGLCLAGLATVAFATRRRRCHL
jgi:hypothetical protein